MVQQYVKIAITNAQNVKQIPVIVLSAKILLTDSSQTIVIVQLLGILMMELAFARVTI